MRLRIWCPDLRRWSFRCDRSFSELFRGISDVCYRWRWLRWDDGDFYIRRRVVCTVLVRRCLIFRVIRAERMDYGDRLWSQFHITGCCEESGVKLLVTGLRKARGLRYEKICWILYFPKYSAGMVWAAANLLTVFVQNASVTVSSINLRSGSPALLCEQLSVLNHLYKCM